MATAAIITWSLLAGLVIGAFIGFRAGQWYLTNQIYLSAQQPEPDPCEICGGSGAGFKWDVVDGSVMTVWLCAECACDDMAKLVARESEHEERDDG